MLATYIRGHNKTEEQVPLREPDLMIVMTGGKIAYTRPDGVKIIPLACLKDVKSWRDDMKWRLSTDIYNCTAPPGRPKRTFQTAWGRTCRWIQMVRKANDGISKARTYYLFFKSENTFDR